MRTIYLPIRSFGDFIITASIVKSNFSEKIPVILPDYLIEIFLAVDGNSYFNIVNTIPYNDQPAFFELYKVKDIKNIQRLVKDIFIIWSALSKKNQYMLDYSSKRLFFTGLHLIWPSKAGNIYEEKFKIFENKNLVNSDSHSAPLIKPVEAGKLCRILILPDSRLESKRIDSNLIDLIINEFRSNKIKVARFSNKKNTDTNYLYYSNFKGLIDLISSYDLIISAESLPYHLAYYLNKPHYVIYNQSRHFKSTFMSPFMIQNQYYSIFTGSNSNEVIGDIHRILSKNYEVS